MEKIIFEPIGYVKNNINSHKDLKNICLGGVKSILVVYDKYIQGLNDLNENSHILVSYYLDRANRKNLLSSHKKFGIQTCKETGVFASRSPNRPNPLAITSTRLIEVKNNEVIIEKCDMFNNTPVIDIKPYSEGVDLIYNTRSLNKKLDYSLVSEENLYSYFENLILNYVFKADDSINLGIYSIIKIIKTLKSIPDREIIDTIETDYTGTALDVLYYFSKYTTGENKLLIKQENSKNSYIVLKLKHGELWKLASINNTLEFFRINQ